MPALMLADRDPHPLRGRWHVDVVDFVFAPQALDDGVDHRWTGADRTRLAGALDAQRIGLAAHVVGLEYKRWTIRSARQRIVHEGAGDELAVFWAVHRLLHERLANALLRASVILACEQKLI